MRRLVHKSAYAKGRGVITTPPEMVEVRGESIFIGWAFYLKFFSFCITVQKRVGIYICWVGTYKVNEKDIDEIK